MSTKDELFRHCFMISFLTPSVPVLFPFFKVSFPCIISSFVDSLFRSDFIAVNLFLSIEIMFWLILKSVGKQSSSSPFVPNFSKYVFHLSICIPSAGSSSKVESVTDLIISHFRFISLGFNWWLDLLCLVTPKATMIYNSFVFNTTKQAN